MNTKLITYTLQERQLLEQQCHINLEGVELAEDITQVREPPILPVLILVSSFSQLVQLFLLSGTSGVLGQKLDELRGRGIGDVQVIGESATQRNGDWHAFLFHPMLLGMRDTPGFHIDWFVRVDRRVEDTDELFD